LVGEWNTSEEERMVNSWDPAERDDDMSVRRKRDASGRPFEERVGDEPLGARITATDYTTMTSTVRGGEVGEGGRYRVVNRTRETTRTQIDTG